MLDHISPWKINIIPWAVGKKYDKVKASLRIEGVRTMAETMKKKNISNIKLGDMAAVFEQSEDTGKWDFILCRQILRKRAGWRKNITASIT